MVMPLRSTSAASDASLGISNNVVRITFCVEREGPRGVEHRVVLHLLRDLDEMVIELERMRKAIEAVSNEPPLNGHALPLAEWH